MSMKELIDNVEFKTNMMSLEDELNQAATLQRYAKNPVAGIFTHNDAPNTNISTLLNFPRTCP